jgi:hypothetical protein
MSRRATRSGPLQALRSVLRATHQQVRRDEQTTMQWITVLWLLYLLVMTLTRHVVPSSVRVASNLGSLDDIRRIVSRYPAC